MKKQAAMRHVAATALAVLLALAPGQPAAQGLDDLRRWLADEHDIDLYGFVELRGGLRLDRQEDERDASLGEARMQLDLGRELPSGALKFKADLVADGVEETLRAELREAHYSFNPTSAVDVRVGRQVLTWGTGDLLFINDLFAKDWESFFIGRDDEYLKRPSDAVRVGIFSEAVNIDLVYQPLFTPSRYIDGSRLSYWHGPQGRIAGRDLLFADDERLRYFRDHDLALRLSRNLDGVEYALYGYRGFWGTPEGLEPGTMKLLYPRLSVYGGSVRGAMLGGISHLEFGYYDSRQDRAGNDPFLRNSEIRLLAGHERELARDLTGGLQYYLEHKQKYGNYLAALPAGSPAADRDRHLLTLRLSKLLMQQNLRLSFFAYWSPSDRDAFLRPKVHYKITDQWAAETGANIFLGRHDHTFWGQFEDNTNAYLSLRRSF
jgi:hypothetical protein